MARPKLLFIGLDSAEPTLLERWADAGELPGLADLLAQSAKVHVTVPEGFANGCAWPSLYTGVNPGRHGRYSSATWCRGSYNYRIPFDEDQHLQADPFWVSLSDRGIPVGIVDMVRAPLTPGIKGFQIADWLTHDSRNAETRSYPANLAEDVLRTYGGDVLGGTPEKFLEQNSQSALSDTLLARIETKTRQTIDFANRFACDLYMTVFGEPHDAGHMFWGFHDPSHPDYDPNRATGVDDPLKRVYAAMDSSVVKTLSHVEADYKILFAGPGLGPNYSANSGLSAILSAIETDMSANSRTKKSHRPSFRSVVRSIMPSPIRAPLRKIVPRPVKSAWDVGDMSWHRFFQIPHTGSAGAIRINLRGREPQGRIEPGQEYNKLCDDLEAQLMKLVNAETNGPVVSKVVRVHDTCSGPALAQLPDLLVVWDRSTPIRHVSLPGVGEYQIIQPARSGDHTPNAVMFVTGPGVRTGTLRKSVRVEDLAPTMVWLLGCEPAGFDGQPISELFQA